MKEIEGEMITLEEANEGSFSHGVDSYGNSQSASKLEKEMDRGIKDAERIIKITLAVDVASSTSSDEQSVGQVPSDMSVGREDSGLNDVQKNTSLCINGSAASVERSSSYYAPLSIVVDDVGESQFFNLVFHIFPEEIGVA